MTITELQSKDKSGVMSLFRSVKTNLRRQGIKQWDWLYPNGLVIGSDLRSRNSFGIVRDGRVVAAIVLDAKQSSKYAKLDWADKQGRPACIHRLAVHPDYQGQGLGKQLLRFAESLAGRRGYSSIRLDVYTENPGAVGMYSRAGYRQVGKIEFPFRQAPYLCFEKLLQAEG
ncbi:GNAT family N-acetyltransferase [Cohnella endophytica]|uniref:GNAT family N-acetyltransferase n=1 Tax=Cohnella endophytica TaxID=2419778 RepID=A0A494XLQ9_9BACL|nr:GNAT family N-acetyltransferase [Cohnella endophytica]RKP51548.1 GNAT family N-acetyltransferase [Cohnella endophytica]